MKRAPGVKGRVIVTVADERGEQTVILYRGGKNGLAFRTPAHRVLNQTAQQRRAGGLAASSPASAAASLHHQGGPQ